MEDGLRRLSFMAGPIEHKEISLAARAEGVKIPEFLRLSTEAYVGQLKTDSAHQMRVKGLIEEDRKVLDQMSS